MEKLTREDYQTAIDIQCACNTIAIVNTFQKTITKIAAEAKGTDYINSHPIVRLFAEQISFLASKTEYNDAYLACEKGAAL